MSHLVIVDGHAIAHRAYHSIPPLTFNGQPVNAIYGFYSMLLSAIDTLNPKYLVVCLDSPGPNFRNEEFLGYRAKRKPSDDNLIVQLPELKNSLETARLNSFALSGFEADDLIAAITKQALKKIIHNPKTGHKKKAITKITIITGDKDLMQLVTQQVNLFVPIRGLSETKLFTPADVKEKLGVNPNQVIDLKGLMGDASDNYPGVAGIGPKSATDLLTQYGTLENVYAHLDEIKPVVKAKLEADQDNAFLSKKLATLVSDIPVKFSLRQSRLNLAQITGLINLFKSYNFRSLVARLEKKNPKLSKIHQKTDFPNQTSLF